MARNVRPNVLLADGFREKHVSRPGVPTTDNHDSRYDIVEANTVIDEADVGQLCDDVAHAVQELRDKLQGQIQDHKNVTVTTRDDYTVKFTLANQVDGNPWPIMQLAPKVRKLVVTGSFANRGADFVINHFEGVTI